MIYKENKGSFIHPVDYGLPFETLAIEEANGCPFNCEYCFLKAYFSTDEIVVYTNKNALMDEIEARLSESKRRRFYLGEYSEPLWANRFSQIIPEIIEIFRKYPDEELEIRTKWTDVDFLREIKPSKNIIFAWSLMPEDISKIIEKDVPPVAERVKAMRKTKEIGFRVAIRLEPIIFYKKWEEGYKRLLEMASFALDEVLEMGVLRLTPPLRKLIYSKNTESLILKEEFVLCKDGKLRYPRGIRFRLYAQIINLLQNSPVRIYMEEDFLVETLSRNAESWKS